MKKIMTVLLLIICCVSLRGQGFSLSLDIDGDANDGRYMIKSHSGTFIIYCSGFCMPELISCDRLIEVNDKGEILKEKLLEDADGTADLPRNIISLNDGGYAYAHSKFNTVTENYDIFVYKRDENFELIWEKKIAYAKDDIIKGIVQTTNGDIVATGWTYSYPQTGYRQTFLLCIDGQTQALKWFKLLKQGENTYGFTLIQDEEGNLLVGGVIYDPEEDDINGYILKTDSLGNEISWYEIPGLIPDEESIYPWDSYPDIVLHPDSGFVYEMRYDYFTQDLYKPDITHLVRFHYNENQEYVEDWRLILDEKDSQWLYSITVAQNGDIIGCGNDLNNPFQEGSSTGLLLRVSPEGELRWLHKIVAMDSTHEASRYWFWDVAEDNTGNIIATGPIQWVDTVYYDIWLVRTDADGCLYESSCTDPLIFTNGIEDVESGSVGISVYPNPTDGDFYLISNDKTITGYAIYNYNGVLQKQQKLKVAQGEIVHIDVNDLPNGIYYVAVHTTDDIVYQKVVIQH
ncbi:MAG: T9SS type A sorting domain-containing protein [Chitinophagales bacterium]|nr:T9SS type A sorting domain-containing protein [Chitinophagales bacterium]